MTAEELDAALAKIKEGYKIFDIGPEAGRARPSPFYGVEKQTIADHSYPVTRLPGY